jgi:hypothetical protein
MIVPLLEAAHYATDIAATTAVIRPEIADPVMSINT